MLDKVKEVEEVFGALDAEIAAFQSRTSLHCAWGCGKCCFKSDIEATPLEFLPFAHHLYTQGVAYEWYEKLKNTNPAHCLILNPTQGGAGLCSQYQHRGLICRLFGYSARTNKYGGRELVTCQIIKSEQKENYEAAEAGLSNGEPVPVMSQYYMRLHAIDPVLTKEFFPINEAIRRAIEVILHYYAYRE
ncbi:YkgJ family cysteine cluster protein [Chryseolinea sp. T2]|uniref:YkgJ family cysteine cluster protein n=1 Tax=Chryseolinea sp. T2 TaxID=3129255 RepID=UPI0030769928